MFLKINRKKEASENAYKCTHDGSARQCSRLRGLRRRSTPSTTSPGQLGSRERRGWWVIALHTLPLFSFYTSSERYVAFSRFWWHYQQGFIRLSTLHRKPQPNRLSAQSCSAVHGLLQDSHHSGFGSVGSLACQWLYS